MPLLSFGALPDDFKIKLLSGEKLQTVREIRKKPIMVGDTLYCWWKSRDPKKKEKLFDAVCTDLIPVEIYPRREMVILKDKEMTPDEIMEFAIADGFHCRSDFFDYFYGSNPDKFQGVVIKFERIQIQEEKTFSSSKVQYLFDEYGIPIATYEGRIYNLFPHLEEGVHWSKDNNNPCYLKGFTPRLKGIATRAIKKGRIKPIGGLLND